MDTPARPARGALLSRIAPDALVWLALVAAVVVAFGPIASNGWVDYDDFVNFVQNPDYRGFGPKQWASAFTTIRLGVYQPIGWLLFSGQYAAFGMDARGYHACTIALHATACVLLHALIVALVGRVLPGVAAARRGTVSLLAGLAVLLYAVHPQRVEPVAWLSAQSYVPSGCFFFLALLAYLRAHPAGGGQRLGWLALAQGLGVASMMAKASGLSAPMAMLLLDAFLLGRLDLARPWARGSRRALVEKLPTLAAMGVLSAIAFYAKMHNATLEGRDHRTLWSLLAQAGYNIWFYPIRNLQPVGMTTFNPLPEQMDFRWPIFYAGVAATAVAVAGLYRLRHRAGLLAAGLGYMALLLPHLGTMATCNSVASDRYYYLAAAVWPLFLALGLCRALESGRLRRPALVGVTAASVGLAAALTPLTRAQGRAYYDSLSLWGHALRHSPWSALMHNCMGTSFGNEQRFDEGIAELREAVRIDPGFYAAWSNLGSALAGRGRYDEAIDCYAHVLELKPHHVNTHLNWGAALCRTGRPEESLPHFREALAQAPDHAELNAAIGAALLQLNRVDEAIEPLVAATRLLPWHADAHANLGAALALRGRADESMAEYREALRHDPRHVGARTNHGILLAQRGRLDEAAAELGSALAVEPNNAEARHVLGAVLAQGGRLGEAADQFAEVLRLQPDHAQARELLAAVRQQAQAQAQAQGQTQRR